ncbi:MAG: rhamnulokinase [Christensenellales bacterium]|jgi:rhamnulokinase
MERRYIAVDLGASNGRVILGTLADDKFTLQEVHRFLNQPITVNGRLYWDTFGLFREICTGLKLAADIAGGRHIYGIGIDTWGVDFGLIDKNGEIVGMPIHYRDTHTDGIMEEAFRVYSKDDIFRETGLAFMQFNTLYQLFAMKKRGSGAFSCGDKLLFMPDLFGWMLTGQITSEYTIASTGQLICAKTREWSEELLHAFELPRELFSEIREPGTILGKLLPEIGEYVHLPHTPVFSVAGHDTASAVAAVPAKGGNSAYLSSGTWSLIGIESNIPHMETVVQDLNFTNEGGVWGTYRILKNVMGLWIVQECRRHWKEMGKDYSFTDLVNLARDAQPFAAQINPDEDVFFRPGRMPEKIIRYCRERGTPIIDDPGTITRVVLESLALRYRWSVEALEHIGEEQIQSLHIVGGGCQNVLLNQLTANAINRPVICGPVEATAIGNLLMQAVGDGQIISYSQAKSISRNTEPLTTFMPNIAQISEWNAAYEKFLHLL